MRVLNFFIALTMTPLIGCNEADPGRPSALDTSPAEVVADKLTDAQAAEMGRVTESFWNRCVAVNQEFVANNADVWFKEFRPKAVGTTCRDAAKRLRDIDNAGVDPEVIDHVNRVIRGFEQIGAIAETKGRESLWRDASAAVGFVMKLAVAASPGAVANGGSIAAGIGASEGGGEATREGQAEAINVANNLMESEEQAIRHVRTAYGIELKPW